MFSTGILCLLGWLGLVIGARMLPESGEIPIERYGLVALLAWLLFGSIASGALIVSSLSSRKSLAGGVGSIWAIGSFLLDLVPFLALSPIGWLNPWHHYFPQEIVSTGALQAQSALLLLGWIIGGVAVAGIIFERRDLV